MIPLELAQVKKEDPKYSVDEDKAPEADFSAGNKRGQETGGIIAILEMVNEDTENEIKTSREEDAEAEADYEKSCGALQETLDAQTASKIANEQELAELQEDIADTEELKDSKASDLAEEQALEASLQKDCAWVESHFDSRRDKRKAEIDGLVEAKNSLAGVGSDHRHHRCRRQQGSSWPPQVHQSRPSSCRGGSRSGSPPMRSPSSKRPREIAPQPSQRPWSP